MAQGQRESKRGIQRERREGEKDLNALYLKGPIEH